MMSLRITLPNHSILIHNKLVLKIQFEFENQTRENQSPEFQGERSQSKRIIDLSIETSKSKLLLSLKDLQLENHMKISLDQSIIITVLMLNLMMKSFKHRKDFRL